MVFRYAANQTGWVEGVDWRWECLEWEEMLADLQSPHGRSALSARPGQASAAAAAAAAVTAAASPCLCSQLMCDAAAAYSMQTRHPPTYPPMHPAPPALPAGAGALRQPQALRLRASAWQRASSSAFPPTGRGWACWCL